MEENKKDEGLILPKTSGTIADRVLGSPKTEKVLTPKEYALKMEKERAEFINSQTLPKFNTADNLLAIDEVPLVYRAIDPERVKLFKNHNPGTLTQDYIYVEVESFYKVASTLVLDASKTEQDSMQVTNTNRAVVLAISPTLKKVNPDFPAIEVGDTIYFSKTDVDIEKEHHGPSGAMSNKYSAHYSFNSIRNQDNITTKWLGDTLLLKSSQIVSVTPQSHYNASEVKKILNKSIRQNKGK